MDQTIWIRANWIRTIWINLIIIFKFIKFICKFLRTIIQLFTSTSSSLFSSCVCLFVEFHLYSNPGALLCYFTWILIMKKESIYSLCNFVSWSKSCGNWSSCVILININRLAPWLDYWGERWYKIFIRNHYKSSPTIPLYFELYKCLKQIFISQYYLLLSLPWKHHLNLSHLGYNRMTSTSIPNINPHFVQAILLRNS